MIRNILFVLSSFFTSETFWNKAQITINGTGVVLPYNHTTKFHYNVGSTEYYYTKTIVQLKKITAVSHFLYYTTHIDNVTASAPNDLQLYAVVYGVNSYLSNVDSSVYSVKLFTTENNDMKMNTDIDMDNHKIINLAEPVNNSDPTTKKYIDTLTRHNITKRYVEISLQNHDTLINILTNSSLKFVLIPDLYNVDIDLDNWIAKITDRKSNKVFAESNNRYKPILKFDEDFGKYYMSFDNEDLLQHVGVNVSDVVGSSEKTNTTFILVKINDTRPHPIFDMSSDFRFSIDSTNVYFQWFHQRYRAENLSIPLGSIQLFTIRIGPQGSTDTLEVFQGMDSTPIISTQNMYSGSFFTNSLDIGKVSRYGNHDLYVFMVYNTNLSNNQLKHIHKYFQNTYFNFEP